MKDNAKFPALEISANFDQLLEIASSNETGKADSVLDFDELSLLDPEITLTSLRGSGDIVEFRAGCGRVVTLVKDSTFLTEVDFLQLHPDFQSRTYLSVHPFVPIMVRASRGWRFSGPN